MYDISSINKDFYEGSTPKDGDDLRYDLEITFLESYHGGQKQFRYIDPITGNKKSLIIKYSMGVKDSNIIRLESKGMPGIGGGSNGDLYVIIHVKNHPVFKRKNDDIITTQEIPYTVAMLGGEIEVTVIGRKLIIKVPPKTKDSTLLRVSNYGFINKINNNKGDFLIKVKINIPDRINAFQKKKLEELHELGL